MTFPIPPNALPLDLDAMAWLRHPNDLDGPDVLETHDGAPFLCVIRNPDGAMFLAYHADDRTSESVYLLTPTSPDVVAELLANRLPLRDAVVAPWMAAVVFSWESWQWVEWEAVPRSGHVIRPEDVPDDHLPVPGVTLYLPRG